MQRQVSGFVSGERLHIEGRPDGPLAGSRFAAKDIFDVAEQVTGGGNPDWRETHRPAARSAPAVRRLLDAGATLVGKTITDEMTRGILGVNAHDGTPVNPRAPDRLPGGSSSGSASPAWAACCWTATRTPSPSPTARTSAEHVEAAAPVRERHRRRMAEILSDGTVVAIPTTPAVAPRRGLRQSEMQEARRRITLLTCIAGGAGLPQVTLPIRSARGLPAGLSLIGPPGADEMLLSLAEQAARVVG